MTVTRVWARDNFGRPTRAALSVGVIGLAILLSALAIQMAQGFLHARDVVGERNSWLRELPDSARLSYGTTEIGGETVEVWTFDTRAAANFADFPGNRQSQPSRLLGSPAVIELMANSEVAAAAFQGARSLSADGVADQSEYTVFRLASDEAVQSQPIKGPARQVQARSAAVDELPLWLGLGGLLLFVVMPACGLLAAAAVVGGRPRLARIATLRRHGTLGAARAFGCGEAALTSLAAALVFAPIVALWSSSAETIVGNLVNPDVWRIGWLEGLVLTAAIVTISAVAGGIHARSRPNPGVGRRRRLAPRGKGSRRTRNTGTSVRRSGAWLFAIGAASLACSAWIPGGYVSLGIWLLGAGAWLTGLRWLLVSAALTTGTAMNRRPRLLTAMVGARLARFPRLWVARWIPLATAMVLLPAGLLATSVLAESDTAEETLIRAYLLRWDERTPETRTGARSAVETSGDLIGVPLHREDSGWRLGASCERLTEELGSDRCQDLEAELAKSLGLPVTVSADPGTTAKPPEILLLGLKSSSNADSVVADLMQRADPDFVTEVAASRLGESRYLGWLLAGLGLLLGSASLITFLVLADRSASAPAARKLTRLGASASFASLVEAATFIIGFGLALAVGLGLGVLLLLARLKVDPSLRFPVLTLASTYGIVAVIGVCGAIAAYVGTRERP